MRASSFLLFINPTFYERKKRSMHMHRFAVVLMGSLMLQSRWAGSINSIVRLMSFAGRF